MRWYKFKCSLLKIFFLLKIYNTSHDILFLPSKRFVFLLWTQQKFVHSKSTIRKKCEICSQLTIKTPERRYWRLSSVFICNLEQFSNLVLVLQWLTLNRKWFVDRNHINNATSQDNTYIPFNFPVTKIHAAIRLAEDGPKIGDIVSTIP